MSHSPKQEQRRHYENYVKVRVAQSIYDKVRKMAHKEGRSIASLATELLELGILRKNI